MRNRRMPRVLDHLLMVAFALSMGACGDSPNPTPGTHDGGTSEDMPGGQFDSGPAIDGAALVDGEAADTTTVDPPVDGGTSVDPNPNPTGPGTVSPAINIEAESVVSSKVITSNPRVYFDASHKFGYLIQPNSKPYLTEDGGTTWAALGVLSVGPENGVWMAPNQTTIAFGVRNRRIVKNPGSGWQEVYFHDTGSINTLHDVVFPVNASAGVVVGIDGAVLTTSDDGKSWTTTQVPSDNTTGDWKRLSFAPGQGAIAMMAGDLGVYKTVDGGSNWTQSSAIAATDVVMVSATSAYFSTQGLQSSVDNSVYKTVDGGATWVEVLSLAMTNNYKNIHDLSSPAGHPGVVYASTNNSSTGGLIRTTDGGKTWTWLNATGESGGNVYSTFFFNPSEGYVATLNGLYRVSVK